MVGAGGAYHAFVEKRGGIPIPLYPLEDNQDDRKTRMRQFREDTTADGIVRQEADAIKDIAEFPEFKISEDAFGFDQIAIIINKKNEKIERAIDFAIMDMHDKYVLNETCVLYNKDLPKLCRI